MYCLPLARYVIGTPVACVGSFNSKMVSPVFLSSARNVDAYAPFTGVNPVASAENSSVLVTSSSARSGLPNLLVSTPFSAGLFLMLVRRLAVRNHPELSPEFRSYAVMRP